MSNPTASQTETTPTFNGDTKKFFIESYRTYRRQFESIPADRLNTATDALAIDLRRQYDELLDTLRTFEARAEENGFYAELIAPDPAPTTMTVKEAAFQLGYDEKKVRRQIRKGDIKARKNESGEWEVFVQKLTITK